ncbi:unnamed protein product [Phyllotreta striolata]|uniref:Uncharacterized protein n=1 Tax=Phyllotreta striolata TaxID=444603 RepID=A0A9N9TLS1_PHYSR|nr:unnamed protein product [Phyllotreta striolata]
MSFTASTDLNPCTDPPCTNSESIATKHENLCLGSGECSNGANLEGGFTEMEEILAGRKIAKERQKIIAFYDNVLRHIVDELDGKETIKIETIENFLNQLINDLKKSGKYDQYESLDTDEIRNELLLILFDKVNLRRDEVNKYKKKSSPNERPISPNEDKYLLPAAISKRNMDKLLNSYPLVLVKKFLEYLTDFKETTATQMHLRHENILTQMREEAGRIRRMSDEAKHAYNNAKTVLRAVRMQYKQKIDAEEEIKATKHMGIPGHSMIHQKINKAMHDTRKQIEDEALKAKILMEQIETITDQTELFLSINDEIVDKTEEQNMKTLKSIRKLKAVIKQYECFMPDIDVNK